MLLPSYYPPPALSAVARGLHRGQGRTRRGFHQVIKNKFPHKSRSCLIDTLAVREIMKWIFQSRYSGQIYTSKEHLFERLEVFCCISVSGPR